MQTAWIIGDRRWSVRESALTRFEAKVSCMWFSNAKQALACLAESKGTPGPGAIVFAQSRPGEFSAADIERLHRAAPLARLAALTGVWCEGEGRSGHPIAGAARVSWCNGEASLLRAIGLTESGISSHEFLPRTATGAERLALDLASLRTYATFSGSAGVVTQRRTSFEAIRDALTRLGFGMVSRLYAETAAGSQFDLVVCDGWESASATTPRSMAKILLLHFPRPEDVRRAKEEGFDVALGQPLRLIELADAVGGLLPRKLAPRRDSAA